MASSMSALAGGCGVQKTANGHIHPKLERAWIKTAGQIFR